MVRINGHPLISEVGIKLENDCLRAIVRSRASPGCGRPPFAAHRARWARRSNSPGLSVIGSATPMLTVQRIVGRSGATTFVATSAARTRSAAIIAAGASVFEIDRPFCAKLYHADGHQIEGQSGSVCERGHCYVLPIAGSVNRRRAPAWRLAGSLTCSL